ncbi:MAG: hypothetical protein DRI01_10925 [Chloroflexi bacterium]|nr:MAG: hypothetical protein DRI01_10925 [Chloroflexota bacterium]
MATDLPVEQPSNYVQIAYQEQETVTTDKPIEQAPTYSELGYQEQETVVKDLPVIEEPTVTDTTPSGGLIWIKIVQNIIRFAFLGKAWLFDGTKFIELGTPVAVIYPVLVSLDDKAYFVGGLKEDGSVPDTIYVYGYEANELEADKDYVAFVISETEVYVVDEENITRGSVKGLGATPINKGWKLISRKPFTAIVMEVKE